MNEDELYQGREQSYVKHQILRRYLQRFARIIGSHKSSLTYIDCFSGPWQSKSEKYEDTSFGIAVDELRKARDHVREIFDKLIQIRCYFIEKDPVAYEQLDSFAKSIDDMDVQARNATLEDSIADIATFASAPGSFPFILIDPTGWKGFGLDNIRPLLQLKPGEVLINFMTDNIRRFIDCEETKESFELLYGSSQPLDKLKGLKKEDRTDAAVSEYMKSVQSAGEFTYASTAVVLRRDKNRSHFHLIYLTRHPKGIEVFKEAEKASMPEMETARAKARQTKRQDSSGQQEMFPAEDMHDPSYFEELRERYIELAKNKVLDDLESRTRVPYDDAWAAALRFPLVWESDLKDEWIPEWQSSKCLQIEGLQGRERKPKVGKGHVLIWDA